MKKKKTIVFSFLLDAARFCRDNGLDWQRAERVDLHTWRIVL